ncbi:hypothetical protein [Frankia sp. Cj3]|uniref:hypothetical protein n=1 Tax=Frankia sp. Cj3 TaxID=2880976 RepID=UPI001EF46F88|nr:hypothetical protein [Frankia sp. Cj3]
MTEEEIRSTIDPLVQAARDAVYNVTVWMLAETPNVDAALDSVQRAIHTLSALSGVLAAAQEQPA